MAFGTSDKFPDIEVSVRGRDMGHGVGDGRVRVSALSPPSVSIQKPLHVIASIPISRPILADINIYVTHAGAVKA
jgi:hypothetical protein